MQNWWTWAELLMRPAPCMLKLIQIRPASIYLSAASGDPPNTQLALISHLKLLDNNCYSKNLPIFFFVPLLYAPDQ